MAKLLSVDEQEMVVHEMVSYLTMAKNENMTLHEAICWTQENFENAYSLMQVKALLLEAVKMYLDSI